MGKFDGRKINPRNGSSWTHSDENNMDFYMRATLHGDAVAQCYLGIMHEKGIGAPMDKHKAAKCYRHAAEQGYPDAQASLEIL